MNNLLQKKDYRIGDSASTMTVSDIFGSMT